MVDISEDGVCTIKLPERFNSDCPRDIITELQELPKGAQNGVIIDMSGALSIDSSGIGMLILLYKELTARSKSLTLKNPKKNIYDLFIEIGVDKLFDVELSSGVQKGEVPYDQLDAGLRLIEEMRQDVCIVSLFGVMNYPSGASLFKKEMFVTLASNDKIILDFKELAYFDGLSVGSLLRVNRILMDNGGAMKICGANQVVRGVLEGMGVNAIVPFFDNREAALDKW